MTTPAILVPGGHGQLGVELGRAAKGTLVHTPGSAELDLGDEQMVTDAVGSFASSASDAGQPAVVINAAAYTAVDRAETEGERAALVNAEGPGTLARACHDCGVALLHVSTDYVFPGDSAEPYEPEDRTGPRSVYGRTKLAGERAVLDSGARGWIVRTAWIYGSGGGNFVKTLARLESEQSALSIVEDQVGSPTWSADLAGGLLELAGRVAERRGPERGVLHCTNSGQTSWFEFAQAVFAELGADPARVRPCSSAEFPRPAPRPAYSVLSNRSWRQEGLTPLRPWRAALSAAFAAEGGALRG